MKDKIQALLEELATKLNEVTSGRFGAFENGFVTSDVQAIALHRPELELLCKSITSEFSDGSAIRVSKPTLNDAKDGMVVFISKSKPATVADKVSKVNWS